MDEGQQEFNVDVASRLGALEAGQDALKDSVEKGFKALQGDLRRYAQANNRRVERLEEGHKAPDCLRFHGGIAAEFNARDRAAEAAARQKREDLGNRQVSFRERWTRMDGLATIGSFVMAGAAVIVAVTGG